jgi:hypothetical protein
MSNLVIRNFLDLSTSHLSEETCRDLNSISGITAHETTHGWLLYAPEEGADELAEDGDWPAELLPIVELARSNGCEYVLFDRDAETTDLLPTFDW